MSETATQHSEQATPIDPDLTLPEEAASLILTADPWAQARTATTETVMQILGVVLEGDSTKLEQLLLKNPNYVNYPIGFPFETHGSRFFNYLAMQQYDILQHLDQTPLEIASGLRSGPVVWVLLAHGSKGSKHPLDTDLAFHNAIKNGRTFKV